jgi:hypothetical protein
MFAPMTALDACKSFFIREGVNIDVLRLPTTIAAFFDFYRDERAEEHFELSFARQLIFGPGNGKAWQLKLTYAFQPTEIFRNLGSENRWCALPNGLRTFRKDVEQSAAYMMAAASNEIGIVSIGYYRTG